MANFNQDNKSGGRRDFGGRSSNRSSMHQAICSNCGKECEVPFKPTGSKPVFCSECFETHGGSNSNFRKSEGRNFGRSSFKDKQMFNVVCDECGSNCKVPFRPTSGKPLYCNSCFENRAIDGNHNDKSRRPEQSHGQCQCQCKGQLEALNNKLDKVLKLLNPVVSSEIAPEEKQEEKIAKEAPVSKPKKQAKTEKKTKASKKLSSSLEA